MVIRDREDLARLITISVVAGPYRDLRPITIQVDSNPTFGDNLNPCGNPESSG
jgi:hypothetical protein